MIKKFCAVMLAYAGIAALTLNGKPKTAITGKVVPADGAEVVWVISGKDTSKSGVSDGQFYFDVKPGTYQLIVDAKSEYKDVILDNLDVKEDQLLDVGEIVLKK